MDLLQRDSCASGSKFAGTLALGDHDVDGEPQADCSSRAGENPPHEQRQQQQQHACAHHYHHQQHRRNHQPKHQQQHQDHHQQQQQQQGGFIRGADRRSLQNVRVIRRTLVYAIGLSPNFSQVNTLKQPEYFGQYGDITKLVINHHHGVAPDDPRHGSASAYITFRRSEDAWAAICSVDGFRIMGRTIRASFGTTKYCNSFLRNLPCNNPDCLYLHELGDQDDRFTKDEVQLGLARHGSSFAFKEEVLGNRQDAADRGESAGGGGGSARQQPTNPVFPPPCAMPPASYQREGARPNKEGGAHHHHNSNNHAMGGNGACDCRGAPSDTGACPGADARWTAAASMGPGSPCGVGAGGGGDDRPRLRRRRGQRGRRCAAGNGDPSAADGSSGAMGAGGGGPAGVQEPHGGVFRLPDHALPSSVPSLERCFDLVGGLPNGSLYRPVPEPTPSFGSGSDRSTASGSSWGNDGCGSPAGTMGSSTPPPLEPLQPGSFSPASAPTSSFFGGFGGSNGAPPPPPPPREMWNHQSQYHRNLRPSPTSFAGMADAVAQRGFLDQQKQLQQQHLLQQQQLLQLLQLQRQHEHLFQDPAFRGSAGPQGFTQPHLDQQHQQHQHYQQHQQYEERGDERATLARLQQQVQQLQRYFETSEGGNGGGRGSAPLPPSSPPSPPSLGLGFADGRASPASGASCFSDELSLAEDRLAALSWGDDGTGDGEGGGATSLFAAGSSPLFGFGSLTQASTACHAEASEWRRATPRLST